MELKDLQGKKFKCDKGEGHINIGEKCEIMNAIPVFLCQNFKSGSNTNIIHGYHFSYVIHTTDSLDFFVRIQACSVFLNFRLLVSEEESESFKIPVTNFKEGTIITAYIDRKFYIEKVDGNLVFVIEDKDSVNEAALFYSKRELLGQEPILQCPIEIMKGPSEEECVYVSVEDVAKILGKDPSKVFIKK